MTLSPVRSSRTTTSRLMMVTAGSLGEERYRKLGEVHLVLAEQGFPRRDHPRQLRSSVRASSPFLSILTKNNNSPALLLLVIQGYIVIMLVFRKVNHGKDLRRFSSPGNRSFLPG